MMTSTFETGRDRQDDFASKKIVTYSAEFGHYDNLLPPAASFRCPEYYCFTDVPERTPAPIVPLKAAVMENPTFTNRYFKLQSFRHFPHADLTIYHDANLRIKCQLDVILELVADYDIVVLDPWHKHWSVWDEFDAIIERGLAAPELAIRQRDHYLECGYDMKNDRCVRLSFMVKKNSQKMRCFEESHWAEILRFTHRDQVSFGYLSNQFELKIRRILKKERTHILGKAQHITNRRDFRLAAPEVSE